MIAILIVGVVLVKATIATPLPMPMPQLIVKSQSNLFREQPGRQIDLSQVLPTKELFWLNLEEVRFPLLVAFVGEFSLSMSRVTQKVLGVGLQTEQVSPTNIYAFTGNTFNFIPIVIHTGPGPKVNTTPSQILRVRIFLV